MASNEDMVSRLERGVIRTAAVKKAMLAVDRAKFVPDGNADVVYLDSPLRKGGVHLSAPGIYATALEGLELKPGLTGGFLNIGSGSGYLSAMAFEILGDAGVHHGVEINGSLAALSRSKLAQLDYSHIEVFHRCCFQLNFQESMRYCRIYIGAGASLGVTSSLLALLQIGGVMVVPLGWPDGSQKLIQAKRLSEDHYAFKPLLAVQFTPLIHTPSAPSLPRAFKGAAAPNGSETLLVLKPPAWTEESNGRFPAAHRAAVRAVLMLAGRSDCLLSLAPKEIWTDAILPRVGYDAFAPEHGAAGAGAWGRAWGGATMALVELTGGSATHGGGGGDDENADEEPEEEELEAAEEEEDEAVEEAEAEDEDEEEGVVASAPTASPQEPEQEPALQMMNRIVRILAQATSLGAPGPSAASSATAPAGFPLQHW